MWKRVTVTVTVDVKINLAWCLAGIAAILDVLI